jgi:putative hydrolase of the HAD superfamily
VLFDLFHTLVCVRAGDGMGPPTWQALGVPRDAWERHYFVEDTFGRALGSVPDPIESVRRVALHIDPTIPDERIVHAATMRQKRFEDAIVRVDDDVVAALRRLQAAGVTTVLVSNAGWDDIVHWPRSPLRDVLDAVIFSCEVKLVKPQREIYEHALRTAGVAAKEALFVGDGGSSEHEGARAVGIGTVLVTRHLTGWWPEKIESRRKLVDWTFHDVPAFVEALRL